MNRETKIGLITGLTLIVLIGALLSSYLSRAHRRSSVGVYGTLGQPMRNDLLNPAGIAYVPLPAPTTQPTGPIGAPVGASAATPTTAPVVATAPSAAATPAPGASIASAPVAVAVAPEALVTTLPASGARSGQVYVTPVVQPFPAAAPAPAVTGARPNAGSGGASAVKLAGVVYTVRRGDTLDRIARHFYRQVGPITIRRIVAANRGKLASSRSILRIGETLRIPRAVETPPLPLMRLDAYTRHHTLAKISAGRKPWRPTRVLDPTKPISGRAGRYRIRPGDTLYALAQRFLGASTPANVRRIMRLNGIHDPRLIHVGMELRIPRR